MLFNRHGNLSRAKYPVLLSRFSKPYFKSHYHLPLLRHRPVAVARLRVAVARLRVAVARLRVAAARRHPVVGFPAILDRPPVRRGYLSVAPQGTVLSKAPETGKATGKAPGLSDSTRSGLGLELAMRKGKLAQPVSQY